MAAPQRLTDRKRVAIVDAAIAEFREHGFDATSMDRIAATAAVSKRTVYNHFPSKDELFAEILQRMWESSVAQPAVPYLADQSLPDDAFEGGGDEEGFEPSRCARRCWPWSSRKWACCATRHSSTWRA